MIENRTFVTYENRRGTLFSGSLLHAVAISLTAA
jgi:hypothetical protein